MGIMSLWKQGNLDPEAGSLLASPYPLSVPRARGLRPSPSTFHVLDFICVRLYFGLRTCMGISCGTTGIRTCSTSPWVPTSIKLKTSKPALSTNDPVSNSCPNIINMSNSSGPHHMLHYHVCSSPVATTKNCSNEQCVSVLCAASLHLLQHRQTLHYRWSKRTPQSCLHRDRKPKCLALIFDPTENHCGCG